MKITKNIRNILFAAQLIILICSVGGCSLATVQIKASDKMLNDNSMEKIAVFGHGKINWPRMGRGGSVLVLPDCIQATENVLAQTKKVLAKKGYEIVCADPVGVGFYSQNMWLVEDLDDWKEEKFTKIKDIRPIFVYPQFQHDQEFDKSVLNVIGQLNLAIKENRVGSFEPDKGDIEVIHQATGADTICLQRLYGKKYSTRRKIGKEFLQLLTYRKVTVEDSVELLMIFIDARTGEVLWQAGESSKEENPINPSEEFVEDVLRFFPARHETLAEKGCTKWGINVLNCKY
ncbi:MAG: hypothetical protein JSU80_00080 [Deltaproteobacteria bacterium]|nr:MAG: hypothetical protein JSU80_00080 [Deltaproteobacteria bacterium]